jgi:hypothetical protein
MVRTVATAVVVLNVFVATVVGLNLRRSWSQRQEQAALSAQSTARLLERSLEAVFDRADRALLAVVDEHTHQLVSGRPDPTALGAMLVNQRARTADILTLRIVDAEGRVVQGVPGPTTPPVSVRDRDYFEAQRGAAAAGLFISRPALPTLFISGYTASVIGSQGVLEAGVHLLHKPFTVQDLSQKVEQALRGARGDAREVTGR